MYHVEIWSYGISCVLLFLHSTVRGRWSLPIKIVESQNIERRALFSELTKSASTVISSLGHQLFRPKAGASWPQEKSLQKCCRANVSFWCWSLHWCLFRLRAAGRTHKVGKAISYSWKALEPFGVVSCQVPANRRERFSRRDSKFSITVLCTFLCSICCRKHDRDRFLCDKGRCCVRCW